MKIGFIAMSGVRANNAELTRLGLTLPGFVERNKTIASLPSLGLLTLAGQTPLDVSAHYVDVPNLSGCDGVPGEYDAVAISSFSAQIKEAYALADRYRALGSKVILGGPHVTALPIEASRHADAVVLGEGEASWPALIGDLRRDQLKPMYDARGQSFDFSEAPMPRFDLLNPERYNRLTVQTQRGCPFNCEFCPASPRTSPQFKTKPIEKVISEIRAIRAIWERPFIEFADDNTFANPAHGKRLLRALTEEKIRWFTETDVSIAEDDDLLGLMRDSGCAQVLIGFESPSSRDLHGLEKNSDWKAKQSDGYLAAIERIQRHGIRVNGCFVLGLDGSDTESFDRILKFVETSGLFEVQVTVMTPFPGTPLYDRLSREGRILAPESWELCTLFDVNFQPDRMSAAELEAGLRHMVKELYGHDATLHRRRKFKQLQSKRPARATA